MTRTLLLEAFRNIGKQLASFISIIIISMLAVLVYLGISFSASAMDQNVSDYYHDRNTQDLQVISPLLLTEGDLESIRALDGVADAEASLETIAWLPTDDGKLEVSVLSMPQRISLPRILAGSAPTSSGECMIENGLAEKLNLKVGDHVNLGGRAEDLPSLLKETSFTISGVFTHPDHITDKISFSPYILVDEEAFDQTLMKGNWSRIRVTLAEMPGNYFLNDYRNAVKPVEDALHELSKDRIPLRYEEVRETYEKQISDGEAELMEAKSKLDDAAKHLAEGEAELENVETQIADGERQLQDGEQKIHEAEVQIADAEKQIHDAEENAADSLEQLEEGRARLAEAESILGLAPGQIDAAEKTLNNTRDLLDRLRDYLNRHRDASYYTSILTLYEYLENAWEEGRTDYYYSGEQYLDGLTAYEQGKKAIEEAETQLRELLDAREQLENKKGELAERKSELEQKRRELDEGKKQVAESRLYLEEKRREYDQGLRDYDEHLRELDDARGQLAQLETGAWIVRNNQADAGFVYCAVNSSNLSSLSSTFSLLFILIAALVIYASVGRMVDEQSVLIGTTKALGLLKKEILLKFMIFGMLGTILGVALGILLAWFLFEPLILHMYAPYYLLQEAPKCFLTVPTLIVVLGGVILAYLSVRIACSKLLKMTAVDLMKGTEKTKSRKERNNPDGSLYSNLIILNMTSDLKRVIVTVISIMGCCILLVIGFTLKYGQDRVVDRQFGGVMAFDAELEYVPTVETAEAEIAGILDDLGTEHITVQKTSNAYIYNGELGGANLTCAKHDSLSGFYNLKDIKTKEELVLPDHGILIPKRMHESFGIEVGDTITFYDRNMYPHDSIVAGVYNNYFGRQIFVSQEAYREIFGSDPEPNCFYVKFKNCEASDVIAAVKNTKGFLLLSDAASSRTQIEDTSRALNVLIIVMIVMAGMMAFFILVNLSGSYIIHKQRELAVMRINGFTYKETKRYAATELIITSLLGILLGLPLGALFGYFIMRLVEQKDLQMVRSVDIRTMLFSALITALFAAFINGMSLRKIRNLKLSDAT